MRGSRIRRLTVCGVAGVVLLSGAVAFPVVDAEPAAAATTCADVLVVGVRGSGDPVGLAGDEPEMGHTVSTAYHRLAENLTGRGYTVQPLGLKYRASSVPFSVFGFPLGVYESSVATGVDEGMTQLRAWIDTCPGKIVLLGYSQGADVLVRILNLARINGIDVKSRFAGMALFGSPQFNPKAPFDIGTFDPSLRGVLYSVSAVAHVTKTIPSAYVLGTRSYCLIRDPVCNYTLSSAQACASGAAGTCAHLRYPDGGWTQESADWLTPRIQAAVDAQPRIITTSLPDGQPGVAYSAQLRADRGKPPYKWSIVTGAPNWLRLDAKTGALRGTPTAPGSVNLLVHVKDAAGATAVKPFVFFVGQPPPPQPALRRISVRADGSQLDAGGFTLAHQLSTDGRYALVNTAGDIIAGVSGPSEYYRKDTITGAIVTVPRPAGTTIATDIGLSGDGTVAAYGYGDAAGTGLRLAVANIESGAITVLPGPDGTPSGVWTTGLNSVRLSGDGRWIAFVDGGSRPSAWRVGADGANLRTVAADTASVDISRDGATLALESINGNGVDVVRVSGGSPAHVAGAFDAALSGDAQTLVYQTADPSCDQCSHVVAENLTTHAVAAITHGYFGSFGGFSPVVSDDGATVAFGSISINGEPTSGWQVYVANRNTGCTRLASFNLDGGPAAGQTLANVHGNIAISGNGRVAAFNSLSADLAPGDTNNVNDAFITTGVCA